jgi:A/G-specific adenine glycosylase
MTEFTELRENLIEWYENNKRDLPWRHTKEPYKIWVSEIILQQTRVNQGLDYYKNFIEAFPDIFILANANIDNVMKLWQGLGYYTRARNMHTTAKIIAENFNGHFPDNFNGLCKLKGIGRYTAAAIASISFNENVPVIDGNVYRFISRLKGVFTPIGTNKSFTEFFEILKIFFIDNNPGRFNQALMELGATICTPVNPSCNICPAMKYCFAKKNDKVDILPVKPLKQPSKTRYFNYFVFCNRDYIITKKRNDNDIWKSLYDLPLVETKNDLDINEIVQIASDQLNLKLGLKNIESISKIYLHKLTHQNIYARFFRIKLDKSNEHNLSCIFIKSSWEKLNEYAIPRLIDKYIKEEFGVHK